MRGVAKASGIGDAVEPAGTSRMEQQVGATLQASTSGA